MLHTRLARSLCLFLGVFGSLAAAQTMPATNGAASAPVAAATASASVPANYSTPLEAAKSLVRASFAKDIGKVREGLVIPAGRADVEAMLDSMEASWQLQAEAKARFGAAGVKAFERGGPTEAEQLKALDGATEEEKDGTATLTLPAAASDPAASPVPGKKVVLKKVAGEWKTDAVGLFDLNSVELAKKVAAIARDVTKEIKDGKLTSATEAYQVFWTRSQAVTTGAGTAPASGAAATKP